jgi:phage terminase small subunit
MPLKRQSTADGKCPIKRTSSRQRLELFVAEYLIDLNATRAAIAAGYSPKTAGQQGSRLLKNVKVFAEIAGKTKERIARLEITADNVLQELARLAFFDPRKFFKPDGSAIPIAELDDDTAMALADFEMIEQFEGSGDNRKHVGYLKKFKIADKGQNLERLGRILGMFNQRHIDLPADWDSHTLEEQEYFVKHGFFPTGITAS